MFVRIKSIKLKNWRNVKCGKIVFPCNSEEEGFAYQSDITGIYGQNGSGKTTLVFAFSLLKKILSGESYKERLKENITIGACTAGLTCDFCIESDEGKRYLAAYEVDLSSNSIHETLKISIYDSANGWGRLNTIFSVDSEDETRSFTPDTKRVELFGGTSTTNTKLLVQKMLCIGEQKSFIFSRFLYRELCMIKGRNNDYAFVLGALRQYGQRNLFVLSNRETGLISLGAIIPLTFRMEHALGTIGMPIDSPIPLPQNAKSVLEDVVTTINTVLLEIIPGMRIAVESVGTELMPDGSSGERVQLVRRHSDGQREYNLPLKYESDGIKKIVSLLHIFIATYNSPDITLVVDELDANIFEYLLGELLRIMDESGKGQLIFTAHNLRPLEVLSPKSVVFTTTNPNNRYTKMQDVKESNNMRLCFFRDITLGNEYGGNELYAHTNSLEIAHAMRKMKPHIDRFQRA